MTFQTPADRTRVAFRGDVSNRVAMRLVADRLDQVVAAIKIARDHLIANGYTPAHVVLMTLDRHEAELVELIRQARRIEINLPFSPEEGGEPRADDGQATDGRSGEPDAGGTGG